MIEIIVQVLKRLLPDLYYEKIKQSYHKFRNHFGFPVSFTDQKYAKYPMTISDAFLWRTDNGYKTKFKYSDILDLFYKIKNSWVEFHFYSKNNELIKIEKIDKLNLSNELEITSKYLNNLEDYGVFYIYHFSDNTDSLNDQDIIINRCYVGYSKNDCLYSFVHGNVFAKFTSISGDGKILSDIIKTSFFKNKKYTIQKYFHDYDRNELFFTNPTSNTIKFSL
ncbi:hypothetical protein OAR81_01760, partial [Candidatus Pelagibacter sp.]|nr:hypothetical protein [Candidatus Pelagibacter sp.]